MPGLPSASPPAGSGLAGIQHLVFGAHGGRPSKIAHRSQASLVGAPTQRERHAPGKRIQTR